MEAPSIGTHRGANIAKYARPALPSIRDFATRRRAAAAVSLPKQSQFSARPSFRPSSDMYGRLSETGPFHLQRTCTCKSQNPIELPRNIRRIASYNASRYSVASWAVRLRALTPPTSAPGCSLWSRDIDRLSYKEIEQLLKGPCTKYIGRCFIRITVA